MQPVETRTYYQFVDYDKDKEENIVYHSKHIGEIVKLARARMRQSNAKAFMATMKDPKFKDEPLAREILILRVTETPKTKGYETAVRITTKNTVAFYDFNIFLDFKATDDTQSHIIPQKINPKKIQRKHERFKKLFGEKLRGRDNRMPPGNEMRQQETNPRANS